MQLSPGWKTVTLKQTNNLPSWIGFAQDPANPGIYIWKIDENANNDPIVDNYLNGSIQINFQAKSGDTENLNGPQMSARDWSPFDPYDGDWDVGLMADYGTKNVQSDVYLSFNDLQYVNNASGDRTNNQGTFFFRY